MKLYVVTTNLPGPGAAPQIRNLIDQMVTEGYEGGVKEPICDLVNEQACEFVELETEDGKGVGPKTSGAEWGDHPTGDFKRLGPFAPIETLDLLRQIVEADGTPDEYARAIDRANKLLGLPV